MVFHGEHLRKDSSLLQVFDTWVSLLPWASSSISAQGAAVMLLHHSYIDIWSFPSKKRMTEPDPPSLSPCKEEKLKSPRQHHTEAV